MERLRISENGRYFIKPDGTPFTWLADTVWTMPQRMKWDDAEYLMKMRKSQGFSVLQMVALDPERDKKMRNPAGEPALFHDSMDTLNEKYFEYLDYLLDKAEEYGFYVLLLPAWGELIVGHTWGGETPPIYIREDNAGRYGEWLGKRYRGRKNILWCLGGDRLPIHQGRDYRNVWRRMAEGIAKGVTGKELKYNVPDPLWQSLLMTYHACHDARTHECSTMSQWDDSEAWISFIMLQSGHGKEPKNYELVKNEYTRARTLPVWDGEPAYEMMPTSWPVISDFHGSWMVRKRAYWSLFSGAFGFTYGHASVWCSVSEKERNEMCRFTWFEALHSEGSGQMKYLREFMDAAQIMTCVPCREILPAAAGEDALDEHAEACRKADGSAFFVYLPSGGKLVLNLAKYKKETYDLWWYNPEDGKFYDRENRQTEDAEIRAVNENDIDGQLSVASPSKGAEKDWVLMIYENQKTVPVLPKEYGETEKTEAAKKVFVW